MPRSNDLDVPAKYLHLLNEEIIPFDLKNKASYDPILQKIENARLVLMGEASHGTQEFYETRNALSQYLIQEKGFQAIAIEGDWTSAYRLQEYLQGKGDPLALNAALDEFKRFPAWMWRNEVFASLIKWIRIYNDKISEENGQNNKTTQYLNKISVFGLDLYCLHASIEAVLKYLKTRDEKAFEQAKSRYAELEQFAEEPQNYGYLVESHFMKACIKEVTEQLMEMQNMAFNRVQQNLLETDLSFYAVQNARLVKNAEHYYRSMFEGRDLSWNVRDEHMAETLENIMMHLENKWKLPAKIIIWAHNSHVGDARATEMSERNEINLGQIVRERFGETSFHLGFSTYSGTVMAANHWDEKGEVKKINPGIPGSFELLFHELKHSNFFLSLHASEELKHFLKISRLMRAIGVIYRSHTERQSHYFFSQLLYHFDAIIHLDVTSAVKPL